MKTKKTISQFRYLLLVLFMSTFLVLSCKKDIEEELDIANLNELGKAQVALLDTMRIWYYWNDLVPARNTKNILKFSSVKEVLNAYKHPSDRFSVIANLQELNQIFSGNPQDYGAGGFRTDAQNNIRFGYVYPNSPLGKEGVTRGCILQKIGTQVTTSNILSAELSKPQNTFEIRFLDGTVKTLTTSQASYKVDPVLSKKILIDGNKRIAYLAYNSFLGNINEEKNRLNGVFGEFKQAGVNELILDLRYNGGGYVALMEHLVNLIAPSSANGKILSQDKWNNNIQEKYQKQLAADALRVQTQPNSLALTRVIIITTRSSASASEQTINNLKPFMNVVTVGSTTYGKPTFNGTFDYESYGFYLTLGVMVNANGEGEFFNGIAPSIAATDDLTRGFGEVEETSLKQALTYIRTGSLLSNGRVEAENQPEIISLENIKTWCIRF